MEESFVRGHLVEIDCGEYSGIYTVEFVKRGKLKAYNDDRSIVIDLLNEVVWEI